MTKFDPTKPVQTRDGREAEICWTDGGHARPIGGWFRGKDMDGKYVGQWYSDGREQLGYDGPRDLINISEKPTTIERWVRVGSNATLTDGQGVGIFSRKPSPMTSTIAIVPVTITFTPGEGLTDED